MGDSSGSKVSYFMVGLGIGALVGILFAPKSGEETREYLSQRAEEGREYAQRKARELRESYAPLVANAEKDKDWQGRDGLLSQWSSESDLLLRPICKTGTVVALTKMTCAGWVLGGICRRTDWSAAVTWAMARSMLASG